MAAVQFMTTNSATTSQTSAGSATKSPLGSFSDCTSHPTGSTSGDFDERMRKWAERKEGKRRLAEQRKKSGYVRGASDASGSQPSVDERFSQKGLPIAALQLVGSGNFARVYRGIWTEQRLNCKANSVVAVKIINIEHSCPRLGKDGSMIAPKWIEREVKTSHVQEHPNLIGVIESSIETLPYAIVMEYCHGGSVHDCVNGDPELTLPRFNWGHRLKAALDVAHGMAYLHTQHIVHRDLKSQNVLLAQPVSSAGDLVHAKVCDFGLARYLPQGDHKTQLTRQVGSWYFMAPEMFDRESEYDERVDVYSFAMLLYEMAAGRFSFKDESMTMASFVVFAFEGGRPLEEAIASTAPEVFRSLIREGWQAAPTSRPSFPEIASRLAPHQQQQQLEQQQQRDREQEQRQLEQLQRLQLQLQQQQQQVQQQLQQLQQLRQCSSSSPAAAGGPLWRLLSCCACRS